MILDIAAVIRALVYLGSPIIAAVFLLYFLVSTSVTIFGSREKRAKRAKRAAIINATLICVPIAIGLLANYVWLSELRQTAHGCETQVSDDGQYTAQQCLLNAGHLYLRLYDNQTKRILADRTYACEAATSELVVGRRLVFDACEQDDSVIELRPSLLDQLRAKLP